MTVFERVRMPSLGGATGWLNSEPLGPAELRGHVALVNFWTLTCINWLRQEPYVRAWSQAYRNDGLVVIGVHTPEFSFEHEIEHVRQATKERGIDYPVALDNDYDIWSAFDNHYWRRSTSSMPRASPATSTSEKGATRGQSARFRSCLALSGTLSPSEESASRRRPTGITSGRLRRISATSAASTSRDLTASRGTEAGPKPRFSPQMDLS
jgi:thiol-disulfide isomerase/thioredoxin